MKAEYCVYRGEEFVDLGTATELAERFNTTKNYIQWCACCKKYKNRKHTRALEVYRIEETEDDND